jgi:diguanylate cyclase (GGDEF)-like protein
VSHQATQTSLAPFTEGVTGGIPGLTFPAPVEEEFREYYSQAGVTRARLMPCFAAMMTAIGVVLRLSGDGPWLFMTVWDLGFFVPLLITTLYLSTQPENYRQYQNMLTLSGAVSGLVVASLYFRPTLPGMPSYFAMEVAWIFAIWLILGLRFVRAAAAALIMSLSHVYGILFLGYESQVLGYEIVMLILVNGIGATCCYHLEYTTRLSFAESLEVEELTKKLTELAEIDGLTGLNNRRTYDIYVDRLWRQAKRERSALTLLLVDIDQFKAYNDCYGHQSGDSTLKAVANVIAAHAKRPLDFAARYGGEEFVLALPGSNTDADSTSTSTSDSASDEEQGRAYAEKLRKAVLAMQIPHDGSTTGKYLTVSVGVAVILPGTRRSLAGAVQMADEALYQAKDEGRNRVVVTQSGDPHFRTGQFRARKPASA